MIKPSFCQNDSKLLLKYSSNDSNHFSFNYRTSSRYFESFTKIVCCIIITKPYQTLLCPSTSPTYSGNCTFAGIINAINIPPPTVGNSAVRSSENLEGHPIIQGLLKDFFKILILPKSGIGDSPIALPALTVPTALTTVLVQFPKGPKHPPWPDF